MRSIYRLQLYRRLSLRAIGCPNVKAACKLVLTQWISWCNLGSPWNAPDITAQLLLLHSVICNKIETHLPRLVRSISSNITSLQTEKTKKNWLSRETNRLLKKEEFTRQLCRISCTKVLLFRHQQINALRCKRKNLFRESCQQYKTYSQLQSDKVASHNRQGLLNQPIASAC